MKWMPMSKRYFQKRFPGFDAPPSDDWFDGSGGTFELPRREEKRSRRRATFLYFAYGSNLSDVQMRERCPDAEMIGPAILYDHRLAFVSRSNRHGVATVEASNGGRVHGLIWRLHAGDLLALDRYEGTPTCYARERAMVEGPERKIRKVQMYRALFGEPALPSEAYLRKIGFAYGRHLFPQGFLIDAVKRAAREATARQLGERWKDAGRA